MYTCTLYIYIPKVFVPVGDLWQLCPSPHLFLVKKGLYSTISSRIHLSAALREANNLQGGRQFGPPSVPNLAFSNPAFISIFICFPDERL